MRYFNLLRNLANWPLYLSVKFDLSRAEPLVFETRPVGMMWGWREDGRDG